MPGGLGPGAPLFCGAGWRVGCSTGKAGRAGTGGGIFRRDGARLAGVAVR